MIMVHLRPDDGSALLATGAGRVIDGDRPSRHGALLGEALALMADVGERDSPVPLGERCATCVFREGTVPNQTAGTGYMALNCVLGIDRDRFACHHGMKNGEPQRICVGYLAARIAPFSQVREIMAFVHRELGNVPADDDVRAAFDEWLREIDPDGTMDVYQVARRAALLTKEAHFAERHEEPQMNKNNPHQEGRIEWNGGECPVKPGTRVRVWFRVGGSAADNPTSEPEDLRWDHLKTDTFPGGGDIVAYEIVHP